MSLPPTRKFITQLLESLPAAESNADVAGAGENSNPLSGVPESAKNQLLALQALFPNEFLPALDLLDRGLVTRLRIDGLEEREGPSDEKDAGAAEQGRRDVNIEDVPERATEQTLTGPVQDHGHDLDVHNTSPYTPKYSTYYVRSAQQRSSRFSTSYDTTTSYEVRLLAWNCSCPAFAFAAFPAVHPEPAIPMYDPDDSTAYDRLADDAGSGWRFGGVSLGAALPPICKHLLACVLVEKCAGLFGRYVEEREVSVEEAAGWAAGWGD